MVEERTMLISSVAGVRVVGWLGDADDEDADDEDDEDDEDGWEEDGWEEEEEEEGERMRWGGGLRRLERECLDPPGSE